MRLLVNDTNSKFIALNYFLFLFQEIELIQFLLATRETEEFCLTVGKATKNNGLAFLILKLIQSTFIG